MKKIVIICSVLMSVLAILAVPGITTANDQADSMFEVWGYVEGSAPYGVFLQALPGLFKLATLLGSILAVILALRGKKPQYTI